MSVSSFYFRFSQEPLLVLGKGCVGASLPLPQQDRTNVDLNNKNDMYEIPPVAEILD